MGCCETRYEDIINPTLEDKIRKINSDFSRRNHCLIWGDNNPNFFSFPLSSEKEKIFSLIEEVLSLSEEKNLGSVKFQIKLLSKGTTIKWKKISTIKIFKKEISEISEEEILARFGEEEIELPEFAYCAADAMESSLKTDEFILDYSNIEFITRLFSFFRLDDREKYFFNILKRWENSENRKKLCSIYKEIRELRKEILSSL